jgi:phage/plasmid-associated DNA primase
LGTLNEAGEHLRRSAATGALKGCLESVDASYVMSCDGPVKILKSMIGEFKNVRFPECLNRVPDGCLCFDNGMYDCATGELRSYRREDLISRTIGYDYVPYEDVPAAHHEFITDFYAKVFPVASEGEYYKRMMARALLSRKQGKYFLVLTDERDGNNGKTTLMRGTERAFGVLKAKTERDFLYESSQTSNSSACPNLLEYIGKKIACFDEPSSDGGHKRMDLQKIKELTSGEAFITARANYGNAMVQEDWQCLIVIACNEANFPKINAADRPFVARMKALKMRGLFVSKTELPAMLADEEEHVFLRDDVTCYKDMMQTTRMAHMHAFIGAYARMTAEGGELGPEPDCVKEMVDKITMASDPRFPKAKQWVEQHINFAPMRTPDMVGKKYFAWLAEKDVLNEFWNWYINDESTSEFKLSIGFEGNKKSAWKMVLKAVMKEFGRTVKLIKPVVNSKQIDVVAYDKVVWMKL